MDRKGVFLLLDAKIVPIQTVGYTRLLGVHLVEWYTLLAVDWLWCCYSVGESSQELASYLL
jgi:hypothetical protein